MESEPFTVTRMRSECNVVHNVCLMISAKYDFSLGYDIWSGEPITYVYQSAANVICQEINLTKVKPHKPKVDQLEKQYYSDNFQ